MEALANQAMTTAGVATCGGRTAAIPPSRRSDPSPERPLRSCSDHRLNGNDGREADLDAAKHLHPPGPPCAPRPPWRPALSAARDRQCEFQGKKRES
jgi:hypothetical protein